MSYYDYSAGNGDNLIFAGATTAWAENFTTGVTTTSTSYVVVGSSVGIFFQFPPSGLVRIDWSSEMRTNTANYSLCSIDVRDDKTIGSGTAIIGPGISQADGDKWSIVQLGSAANQDMTLSNFMILNLNVSGTGAFWYNARLMYRTSAATTLTVGRRRISAQPVF